MSMKLIDETAVACPYIIEHKANSIVPVTLKLVAKNVKAIDKVEEIKKTLLR